MSWVFCTTLSGKNILCEAIDNRPKVIILYGQAVSSREIYNNTSESLSIDRVVGAQFTPLWLDLIDYFSIDQLLLYLTLLLST